MQLNKVFLDWLHQRKITDKVIEEFGLRTEGDKLVIPVKGSDGLFSFNKYRRSPLEDEGPKYTYDKGGKMALYGGYQAKDANRVLWTEGEMDSLVAWSHNIPAVSSTGGALSIDPAWQSFFLNKEVLICFDNDPAGAEGMVKALKVIPEAKIIFLPDQANVKDISDYVACGGDLNKLVEMGKHFQSLEDVIADRSERLAMWKSTYFHDAYAKEWTPKPKREYKRSELLGLERAKVFPLEELLDFHEGKALCPFHAEKEGSLHLYRKENRAWCFGGCGRGYDSIDIHRKLFNCSFAEAVKALSQ